MCLQAPLPAWSPALSPAWPPWNWGSGQCHGDVALGRSSRCSCPQKEDAIPFSTLARVWHLLNEVVHLGPKRSSYCGEDGQPSSCWALCKVLPKLSQLPLLFHWVVQAMSSSTTNACSLACRDLRAPEAEPSCFPQGQTPFVSPLQEESRSVGLAFEPRHLLC